MTWRLEHISLSMSNVFEFEFWVSYEFEYEQCQYPPTSWHGDKHISLVGGLCVISIPPTSWLGRLEHISFRGVCVMSIPPPPPLDLETWAPQFGWGVMCNALQNCIVGSNAFWVIVHDGKLIQSIKIFWTGGLNQISMKDICINIW